MHTVSMEKAWDMVDFEWTCLEVDHKLEECQPKLKPFSCFEAYLEADGTNAKSLDPRSLCSGFPY